MSKPNKPNRGVLLMDIFVIACIFLKSNQKRQKNHFFFCLLKEGKERRNKKRSRTAQGTDALLFSFIFFSAVFLFHLFLSRFSLFSLLAWAPVPIFLFFFFPPVPATCHFCPLLSFSFFIKQKEKERPSRMSFLSRFFSASFQGQKKDSQHSASSA